MIDIQVNDIYQCPDCHNTGMRVIDLPSHVGKWELPCDCMYGNRVWLHEKRFWPDTNYLSRLNDVEKEVHTIKKESTMIEIKRFRKKPIVISAFKTNQPMVIQTLEGEMKAEAGDWIITGVNGEIYPCKPDIFEKTYELVEE